MKTNYVLIDYENVQPKGLELLSDGTFKVKVFLGPNQAKIPVALATKLQELGNNAEYVLLETSGSNALDFHIAYYVGVLVNQDPEAFFHIISKDTGFDPLIKHIRGKGVKVQRSASIADMSVFKPKPAPPATSDAQVQEVVAHLTRMKAAKPRAQKTLLSTIHALFKTKKLPEQQLSEQRVADLFDSLCKRGIVKVDGTKVSYNLPTAP